MDGITILHTSETLVNGGGVMIFFGIITTLLAILSLVLVVSCIIDRDISFALFLLGLIGFSVLAVFSWKNAPPEYETRYQVTIDDTVNFNDFQERYRIIKQEGKIYTIVDKEESN